MRRKSKLKTVKENEMEKFKCDYEADDGYCGGSRPQHFSITDGELDEDMDEEQLEQLFDDSMQEAFTQKVTPYAKNKSEFVEWAKGVIAKMVDSNE